MDFGELIKKTRNDNHLTQEDMAGQLHVTRQAISNWENNKNLPDIGMVISIAKLYNLSLDKMILGGSDMNKITEKLISDGNEGKRSRRNMVSFIIGGALLLVGLVCFVMRPEVTIDENGMLEENLLTPISFFFMLCGVLVFVITGIKDLIRRLIKRK